MEREKSAAAVIIVPNFFEQEEREKDSSSRRRLVLDVLSSVSCSCSFFFLLLYNRAKMMHPPDDIKGEAAIFFPISFVGTKKKLLAEKKKEKFGEHEKVARIEESRRQSPIYLGRFRFKPVANDGFEHSKNGDLMLINSIG